MTPQQLDLQCIRDNSSSTAYGRRQWTCINCGQGFSRGLGNWVQGTTQQDCNSESRVLGQLANIQVPLVGLSLKEVQHIIVSLRQTLKATNLASYRFCCSNCYLTHNLRLM